MNRAPDLTDTTVSDITSAKPATALRLGVVGYGAGGRKFHTPHIAAASGVSLAGIVARSHERQAEATADWPDVPVSTSLRELLASGVDAVTITTPPETHRDLALEAIAAGVHVVVDKPFVPSAPLVGELTQAAESAGVLLNAYHNRRWDGDIRTAAAVMGEGSLGDLWRVYSRFDLDETASLQPGSANGLLLDLGSHLVDQLIWLLGPVRSVTAHLNSVDIDGGSTDAGFTLDLVHSSGITSYAEASKANRITARELRLYGSEGSYRSLASGEQLQGPGPLDPSAAPLEGILSTQNGQRSIPILPNRWSDFYTSFAAAARGAAAQPVPATEARQVLEVLDAARKSHVIGMTIKLR